MEMGKNKDDGEVQCWDQFGGWDIVGGVVDKVYYWGNDFVVDNGYDDK